MAIELHEEWICIAKTWPEAQALYAIGRAIRDGDESGTVTVSVDDFLDAVERPSIDDIHAGMLGRVALESAFADGAVIGQGSREFRSYAEWAQGFAEGVP